MTLTRYAFKFLLAALLLGVAITPLLAQNAQINGAVTDPSGAVIPGATIVVTGMETGTISKTVTNAAGNYVISQILPGRYRLEVQQKGFKTILRSDLVLHVSDSITLNFTMEVGTATQTVTVTAEAPVLRTTDAEQGLVIDNKRIMELPQYDRNPLAFISLAPNVYGGMFNGGRGNAVEYYLDGSPITVGYPPCGWACTETVPPSLPSKEAMDEFKVITNGVTAEYGRLSGGGVVMSTKGGTNNYHGEAYEFFKNQILNAEDWSSNRYHMPKSLFHDNVFGASFGGPVRIPKVYNGRDKTFFFLNEESDRHRSAGFAELASVPTDLEKQGDFTQSLFAGLPAQIFDPLTGVVVNGVVERQPFANEKIPANRWNPQSVRYQAYFPEPNTAPYPGTNDVNNYLYSLASPLGTNMWTSRVDENWSASNTTHFSLMEYDYNNSTMYPYPSMALYPSTVSYEDSYTGTLNHNWVINPTSILTLKLGFVREKTFSGSTVHADDTTWGWPANVITLMGGVNNGRVPMVGESSGGPIGGGSLDEIWNTNYVSGLYFQKMLGKHTIKAGVEIRRYHSNEETGGTFGVSSDNSTTAYNRSYAPINGDTYASYLLGIGTWGQGTQYAGPCTTQAYDGAYVQDQIKFTKKLSVNAGIRWDYEPPRTERWDRELFWDRSYTWNVTLDPGWSWAEVEQQIGLSLPTPQWITNGIHGRVAEMGTPEYPGRSLEPDLPYHFAPRIGVAYQLTPKTVIRSSYGLMWGTKTGNWFLASARWNVGYGDAARLLENGTDNNGLTYLFSFDNPMPGNAGYVPFTHNITALNSAVLGTWWLSETAGLFTPSREHTGQVSIQHELGSGRNTWLAELSYNASVGEKLPGWLGIGWNELPDAYDKIGYLGSNLLTPVPNPFNDFVGPGNGRSGSTLALGKLFEIMPLWDQITTYGDPDYYSNYNAFVAQIEHRFAHGFGFLANYTLSKEMTDGGQNNWGGFGYVQAGLPYGKDDYANIRYPKNMFVFNYSYELPFGKGRTFLTAPQTFANKVLDKVVGGWTIAGITTASSGSGVGPYNDCPDWFEAGQGTNSDEACRPAFVSSAGIKSDWSDHASGHRALIGAANYQPWLNFSAFRTPQFYPNPTGAAGVYAEIGNVPSNLTAGPWSSDWDFSLMKNFYLGKESRYLQLRMEAYNLWNHMDCGNPGAYLTGGAAQFGMITGPANGPRNIMVAMKLYF